MKLTLTAESMQDGDVSIRRQWHGGPADLAARANLVNALRMFANAVEATPLEEWQVLGNRQDTASEPMLVDDWAAWNCT